MRDILSACQPGEEILGGHFNPELFKASLSRVLEDYANGRAEENAASIYSDPMAFFRDATYPTQGLKDIINNALGRLVLGDLSRPALQRLNTAFGGGKIHTLIALTHVALRGKALAEYAADTAGIVDSDVLPTSGSLRVVDIIGDTVDTLREAQESHGKPRPNTLWWPHCPADTERSGPGSDPRPAGRCVGTSFRRILRGALGGHAYPDYH